MSETNKHRDNGDLDRPIRRNNGSGDRNRTRSSASGSRPPRRSGSSNDDLAREIRATMERNDRPRNRQNSGRRRPPQGGNYRRHAAAAQSSMNGFKAALIAGAIIIGIILIVLIIIYIKGIGNSKGKFFRTTVINGVDVSEMTEAQAYNAIMKSSTTPENIVLTTVAGKEVSIPMKDIGYTDNIKPALKNYMDDQNYYFWFTDKDNKYDFQTEFTYDKDKLRAKVKEEIINKSGNQEPKNAYIVSTASGFEIVKEVKGDKIDDSCLDTLMTYIFSFLDKGEYNVDLSGADIYQLPKVVAADLQKELKNLENISDIEITFDFGYATETLYGSEFKSWIIYGEKSAKEGFDVDESMVESYVERLSDKYDTFGKSRNFKSTSKGDIVVPQGRGNYGWWLDKDKMRDYIIDLIKEGDSVKVEPKYYVNPDSNYTYTCKPEWRTAESDIGDTYCEVDISKQHFWFYKDGELKHECNVVTGLPTPERETPEGVYKLWIKERNATLKGESWNTKVSYWNNISTFGIGFHDATWQPYFGGTRYLNYGSHGCINMSVADAKYVYENVPMLTPVIIYR